MRRRSRRWSGAAGIAWMLGACLAAGPSGADEPAATSRPASRPAEPAAAAGAAWLDEVTVTANRAPLALRELPATAVVVEERRLERGDIKNAFETLADQPAIQVQSRQDSGIFGGGVTVRGLDTNATSGGNVVILLDGIPQRRLSFGGPYIGGLPMDAVTRVEFVSGPLSTQYGRGALAGAMQLLTDPGDPKRYGGTAQVTYDTNSQDLHAYSRLFGPICPGLPGSSFALTTSGEWSDGWQENADGRKGSLYFRGQTPLGKNDFLTLTAGAFSGREDVASPVLITKEGKLRPGLSRDTNLAVPHQNNIDLQEERVAASWEHDFDETARTRLTFSYWNGDTFVRVGRPDDAPASGTVVNRSSSNRRFEEEGYYLEPTFQKDYTLCPQAKGQATVGANAEYWTIANFAQSIRAPGATFAQGIPLNLATGQQAARDTWIYGPAVRRWTTEQDYGAFATNETTFFERLKFQFGVRADTYQRDQENLTNGQEASVRGHAVSPSAGLSYQLLGNPKGKDFLTAYTNWGMGFNPVFRAGAGTAELAPLDPETSRSVEAGLKGAVCDGRLAGTVALYRIQRNDVVDFNQVAMVQENVGDWDIRGVEFDVRATPVNWLDLYANYTTREPLIARKDGSPAVEGNRIPFVADDLFKTGFEVNHRRQLFFGLDFQWTGLSFADEANTVHLPAHAEVGAHVTVKRDNWTFTVFARNLFDEEYFSGVFSGVKNGSAFMAPGRTIGFTLATTW